MAGCGIRSLSRTTSFLNPISLRRLSTAGALDPCPPPSAHFSVREYLVNSCGLSKEEAEAASVSPALARLRSPERPDAVLALLRERGLAGDEIAALVSRTPRLLCARLESELAAKLELFGGLGFSADEVNALLRKRDLPVPSLSFLKKRVEFLSSIVGEGADLRKVIKRSMWILTGGITVERRMVDSIAKLREWGISSERIKALILTRPGFFQMDTARIDDAASAAEVELGISRDSNMFVLAVIVLTTTRESARQAKYEVFESFGWSKFEILALYRTCPNCFTLGVARIARHLEFLMNKAGLSAAYISKYATILSYSLERRIIPRYELFCALKAKKIPSKKLTSSLYAIIVPSEDIFQRRYVDEFMKLEPDACQVYLNSIKR